MESMDTKSEKISFHALQNISGARFDILEKLKTHFGSWEDAWNASAQDIGAVLTGEFTVTFCRLRSAYDRDAEWHAFEKKIGRAHV